MGDIHIHLKKQHFFIVFILISLFGIVLVTNALDTTMPYHSVGQVDFSDGEANSDLDLGGNSIINYGNDFASQNWVNNNFYTQEELYTSSEIDNTFATKDEISENSDLDCITRKKKMSSTNAYAFYTRVYCPDGYIMTGGGVDPRQYDTYRHSHSHPSGNGFYCYQEKDSYRGDCYVRCCRLP